MGTTNKLEIGVLSLLSLFAIVTAAVKPAQAGLTAISAGAAVPYAMGNHYQTLESGVGVLADAMMDFPLINPRYTQLHFTFGYDPYTVRNQSNIGLRMLEFFGGIQILNTKDYLHTVTPFFSFQIGAAFDWMTFTNSANVNTNSSVAFASQIAPGIDIPVHDAFGIVMQMPVKLLFFKSSLVTLSPSISIRMKL